MKQLVPSISSSARESSHFNLPTRKNRSGGFTIVELLIVIVVIGILAAVTIVAYSGIQQKARVATIQSDLVGATKTLEIANLTGGAYPTTLLLAKLKTSPGTVFTYSPGTNPASYSLTATNSGTSYVVTNTNTTPTPTVAPPPPSTPVTIVYSSTTNMTVPAAVTSIHIQVAGGADTWYGDAGGVLVGDMVVVPGDVLHMVIGFQGYRDGGDSSITRNALARAAYGQGGSANSMDSYPGTTAFDPTQVTGVTQSYNYGSPSVTLTYTPAG